MEVRKLTSEENIAQNADAYKNAYLIDTDPKPIEPVDREWGVAISGNTPNPSPFERINKILSITKKTTNGFVSPDRAELVTQSYKEHPGEPVILQCAYGVANTLDNSPIYIFPHELVVGCLGCDKKGAPVFPEFGLNWVVDEMRDGLMDYSEERTHDYFSYTEETQNRLEALRDFWNGRTVEDMTNAMLTDDELKGSHAGKGVFFADAYIFCGAGHLGLEYDRLLRLGFGGIREKIKKAMAELDPSNPEDLQKRTFLKAEEIVNDASIRHVMRYSRLAYEMAEAESDEKRAAELRKMSEDLAYVSENPARTFWQALQLVNLSTSMVYMECNGHSICYGRLPVHVPIL